MLLISGNYKSLSCNLDNRELFIFCWNFFINLYMIVDDNMFDIMIYLSAYKRILSFKKKLFLHELCSTFNILILFLLENPVHTMNEFFWIIIWLTFLKFHNALNASESQDSLKCFRLFLQTKVWKKKFKIFCTFNITWIVHYCVVKFWNFWRYIYLRIIRF